VFGVPRPHSRTRRPVRSSTISGASWARASCAISPERATSPHREHAVDGDQDARTLWICASLRASRACVVPVTHVRRIRAGSVDDAGVVERVEHRTSRGRAGRQTPRLSWKPWRTPAPIAARELPQAILERDVQIERAVEQARAARPCYRRADRGGCSLGVMASRGVVRPSITSCGRHSDDRVAQRRAPGSRDTARRRGIDQRAPISLHFAKTSLALHSPPPIEHRG